MKKLLSSIIAAGMLFFAGQAAAFSDNDLVLVAYNENANESATVLGNVNEIDYSEVIDVTLDLSDIGVDSWADVSVGAFSSNGSSEGEIWFATTLTSASEITESMVGNFVSAFNSISALYGDDSSYVGLASETLSYDSKMNLNSSAAGIYGGVNSSDVAYGEATLEALDDGGSEYLYLYHFVFDLETALATDFETTFILDTGIDSSTEYTGVLRASASAVPIPGSLLLLGSGILGLLGIRRK